MSNKTIKSFDFWEIEHYILVELYKKEAFLNPVESDAFRKEIGKIVSDEQTKAPYSLLEKRGFISFEKIDNPEYRKMVRLEDMGVEEIHYYDLRKDQEMAVSANQKSMKKINYCIAIGTSVAAIYYLKEMFLTHESATMIIHYHIF